MREIKFRAWDKTCNVMHSNSFNLENPYQVNIGLANEKDLVWMQYTGLKDKNGKEIYEGDILNTHANFDTPYIREVVWKGCALEFKPITGFTLCETNTNHFEVIGNIYENPELLSNENLQNIESKLTK
jgi:hypothetical protein